MNEPILYLFVLVHFIFNTHILLYNCFKYPITTSVCLIVQKFINLLCHHDCIFSFVRLSTTSCRTCTWPNKSMLWTTLLHGQSYFTLNKALDIILWCDYIQFIRINVNFTFVFFNMHRLQHHWRLSWVAKTWDEWQSINCICYYLCIDYCFIKI